MFAWVVLLQCKRPVTVIPFTHTEKPTKVDVLFRTNLVKYQGKCFNKCFLRSQSNRFPRGMVQAADCSHPLQPDLQTRPARHLKQGEQGEQETLLSSSESR